MIERSTLSRRLFLGGTSVVAGAGFNTGFAKAPILNAQAPYFYRFKIGTAEATIISDGVLPLGDPLTSFLGPPKEEISRMLTDNFLPTDNAVLEQNILVLNTGDRVVLFDTGMGISTLFGPTPGKLVSTLKASGIDPADVDAVVMSHAHIDHCGGLMSAGNTRNFPNAQYYITQSDYEYWTDPEKVGPSLKPFLEQAQRNLTPNRDRIIFIKDGQEFLPGITAIAAPGHTVGHTIFMINAGGKSLCYIGDLTHHPVLLMEKPLTEFAYDTDSKLSAQTRVRMLNMLAANKIPVLAYHFAWPGVGHVAKQGDGFRYYPLGMDMGGVSSI
jgi:glyoxylase-like metal-dependent hydrolase (beta-lactamase superfamily II)